jgi:hypothetical protein
VSPRFACVLGLAAWAGSADAQFFAGPPGNAFFLLPPTSSMGTVTNNLTITNFVTHFTVSGQVIVNVPAGAVSGPLVDWIIRRPLDPGWGTGTLYTATQLIGFSLPPSGGTYGNTTGAVQTYATSYPTLGPGGSISIVPMALTNGAASWGVIVGSFPFVYTSGGTNWVEQRFSLNGDQISGAGGNWVIDVPVDSFLSSSPIPEPAGWMLFGSGAWGLAGWHRRRLKRRQAPRP